MNHVYKLTEIVGTSDRGTDDAIRAALDRARATLRNISSFQVVDTRGRISPDGVAKFEVTVRIGFEIERVPAEPPTNLDFP